MKAKATVITIGDELLIGQIIDTNSTWIGQQLSDIGIPIVERIAVADSNEAIINGIKKGLASADIILVTGGLGPTKDDVTKASLAELLGVELAFHAPTYDRIVKMFDKRGITLTDSHRRQCYLPKGCTILENSMGTAPGMLMKYNNSIIISMPGVPYEMKAIMTEHVIGYIAKKYTSDTIIHRTIKTAGIGETNIEKLITDIEENLPSHIKLAYLPSIGEVKLRLSGVGQDEDGLRKEVEEYVSAIKERVNENFYGYDLETLEEALGKICIENGITIGTAESCTGGNVARRIVSIPGSSRYFQGGAVTYTNRLKEKLLGVKPATLSKYGAVSEETVREMAEGAISLLEVDYSVAISGTAGPTGSTQLKPVGTIWIAYSDGKNTEALLIKGGKYRDNNIHWASSYALNQLRKFILRSLNKS